MVTVRVRVRVSVRFRFIRARVRVKVKGPPATRRWGSRAARLVLTGTGGSGSPASTCYKC